MWYDLNERPYPEAVRITGRPPKKKLPPAKRGGGCKAEWAEIRAYEDAGLIYTCKVERDFQDRLRSNIKKWHNKQKQLTLPPVDDIGPFGIPWSM